MHQHSIERVETFVGAMLDVLTGQLQTLRTRVQIGPETLSDPASAPSAAFLKVTQDRRTPTADCSARARFFSARR
jgi:hypothetical protein